MKDRLKLTKTNQERFVLYYQKIKGLRSYAFLFCYPRGTELTNSDLLRSPGASLLPGGAGHPKQWLHPVELGSPCCPHSSARRPPFGSMFRQLSRRREAREAMSRCSMLEQD